MNQSFAAHPGPLLLAEEALLRRSYDQLQATLSIGRVATWSWHIGSDKVYGDQNLLRLFDVNETLASE